MVKVFTPKSLAYRLRIFYYMTYEPHKDTNYFYLESESKAVF